MKRSQPTILPEWADHQVIMMAWPHGETDWAPLLDEATDCYTRIVEAITPHESLLIVAPYASEVEFALRGRVPSGRVHIFECPTDDTWIRDYGPLTMMHPDRSLSLLDFRFRGWGGKFAAEKDNAVNRALAEAGVFQNLSDQLDVELEGGNVESNGQGVIMVNSHCLRSNRIYPSGTCSPEQLVAERTGTVRILPIDRGQVTGDDTDSHIDTIVRFASPHTLLYVEAPRRTDPVDPDFVPLKAMETQISALIQDPAWGIATAIPLPYADPVTVDGERLPATYANFLITPSAVFVPTYGLPTDADALRIIGEATGRRTIGIDCLTLLKQHGSLHCATMQIFGESIDLNAPSLLHI